MVYTLLLYSLDPYRWTDRQIDRETNTLALRGLEEPFFQLSCVSFWFWREIGFGLHTHVLRLQFPPNLSCHQNNPPENNVENLAGTRSTLFSGGLFWDRAGNSFWCHVRF
jgi:hypothetical protein